MNKIVHDLEKMLRRIEIQRLYDDHQVVFTLDELAEISSVFMNQSVQTKDWRYLNAALKINDLLYKQKHAQIDILRVKESDSLEVLRRFCGLT